MGKLYTYGEHPVFPDKMQWLKSIGWYLTDQEDPATEDQQKTLVSLGWGRDRVSYHGAEVIIQEILENVL